VDISDKRWRPIWEPIEELRVNAGLGGVAATFA